MSPIEKRLDPSSLATLRAAYDRETLDRIARERLIGPYPPGSELPRGILTQFYPVEGDGGLPARERELVVLSLLLGQNADATQIAIHVYWGLMEGLTVKDVVETCLLTGYYAGIFRYQRALGIIDVTLGKLVEVAAQGDASVGRVLGTVGPAVKGM